VTDVSIRRWLGPSRILQFTDEDWISIPEGILKQHSRFFALWGDNQTLNMTGIPKHVAHVVVNYLYTSSYENLQVQRSTEEARNMVDFTTSIYVHSVGLKYHLPQLRQLAAERISIYGDNIGFVEIVKTLSNPPFKSMAVTGALRDYVYHRASQEGQMMSKDVQRIMGGTMAGLLCQRIASLEAEKGRLHRALGNK
jgi:hypothetical protein